MASRSSQGPERASMSHKLREAQSLFKKKRYAEALRLAKELTWLCPCNKKTWVSAKKYNLPLSHLPLPVCHCRDFVLAAKSPDKTSVEKLVKEYCVCGSGITRCSAEDHCLALSLCSNIYEALKKFDAAYQYAILCVLTNPKSFQGYLLVARVLYAKRSINPLEKRVCKCMAKQGREVLWKYSNASRKKEFFQAAEKRFTGIHDWVTRTDPVGTLALEILLMIFKHLSCKELCAAMTVSKGWQHIIKTPDLWKSLVFGQKKPVSNATLSRIITNVCEGGATAVTISDARLFDLTVEKIARIMHGLRRLRSLTINSPMSWRSAASAVVPYWLPAPPPPHQLEAASSDQRVLGRLESLCLRGVMYCVPQLFELLIERAASTLKELTMAAELRDFDFEVFPNMPQLTSLKVLDLRDGSFSLEPMVAKTPRLKKLYMSSAYRTRDFPVQSDSWHWSNLEELAVDATLSYAFSWPITLTSEKLRAVHVQQYDVLYAFERAPNDHIHLDGLEAFFCWDEIPIGHLKTLLSKSCQKRKLRALVTGKPFDPDTQRPVKEWSSLDFINHKDIEVLGMVDFAWSNEATYLSPLTGQPFLDWVDLFPNVHTVIARPERFNAWPSIIEALILRGIKNIYTLPLLGMDRDRLTKMAEENGTKIFTLPPKPIEFFFENRLYTVSRDSETDG
ncbi:hypothetical protein NKR23_g1350 [Pleurostoma richardsiae]|uniref:F-box domain-containing protein n=1 Tax=Pleurostoma richardsiae TaxID=41990 RepID=A0AA38S4J8_9PEZI|nr:hypothetical protein NKR23_g1350 [Pleurostoma richardsiae]